LIKSSAQKGFTLIELIIVVAIIGLLAAVALPGYQNFTKRAKFSEVILAASACRTLISEVYLIGGQDSVTAGGWGCESSTSTSKYVASVATDPDGKISVTAQNIGRGIDGNAVTLVPADSAGAALTYAPYTPVKRWICGSTVAGTSIPDKYLPASCRGL
jgi:type IV pilus assembly protein PilA